MTIPSTYRTSSANGWLGVFGSTSKRPELTTGKEVARQLKNVAQAVPAGQPEENSSRNSSARRSREEAILDVIRNAPIDMAPDLRPLFSAFLIIGVGYDDALQYSLDAIDRAVVQMKSGSIDEAQDTLRGALSELAHGIQAGGPQPPANPLTAPGRPARPPGA